MAKLVLKQSVKARGWEWVGTACVKWLGHAMNTRHSIVREKQESWDSGKTADCQQTTLCDIQINLSSTTANHM